MIKTNTKTFLVILVTLIIGIAIGFEVGEILIKKRFDEFKNIRQPRGLVDIFGKIIKPDEKQKPLVDSVIFSFHKRIDKIMNASRLQMDKQLDTLKLELKPYLNKDQIERFDEELNRMKKSIPNDSTRKGPPPGFDPNDPSQGPGRDGPPPKFDGKNPPPQREGDNPPPEYDRNKHPM